MDDGTAVLLHPQLWMWRRGVARGVAWTPGSGDGTVRDDGAGCGLSVVMAFMMPLGRWLAAQANAPCIVCTDECGCGTTLVPDTMLQRWRSL